MGYKCFRSLIYQSTEPAVIVLEDLSVSGFATLQAPEDYATSKMIFQRLAVFHAASFYRLENVRKSLSVMEEILFFSCTSREPIIEVSIIPSTTCPTRFKSRSSDTI